MKSTEQIVLLLSINNIAKRSCKADKLDPTVVEFGPLKNVLLTHNICVDEQIAISNTKMLLTGCTLETLKVVHFVTHTHGHFKCTNSLLTGRA